MTGLAMSSFIRSAVVTSDEELSPSRTEDGQQGELRGWTVVPVRAGGEGRDTGVEPKAGAFPISRKGWRC